ncbi:MAG TPA: hypothetical protein VER12_05935 [Polyangiaceae bacterium]|nr:hypothetical protein [Polyangiaceae bacterium]
MARLPPVCNVFGYLHSNVGLRPIASALCSRLGLTADQLWVSRGSSEGIEELHLETARCSLETGVARRPNTWRFDGTVAGEPDEIFATLLPIVQNLRWAGFSASFEIYDHAFRLVAECPRQEQAK